MLLINPSASSVDWKSRMAANSALVSDHDLTTVETTKRDDATGLARQAAEDGFEAVVVLGGDGTLNEAANGLAGTSTALAALPGGSTNVFARTSVEDGFFTICLNTNPYTYLGARPLSVTPDTGPERGLVTVTTKKLKVRT